MPTSIRLDPELEQALEALALQRGESKSELIRQAIRQLVSRERPTPYERVADLVGCVSGGAEELSEQTGEGLRRILVERERNREPAR